MSKLWSDYYQAVKDRKLRPLFVETLEHHARLRCGAEDRVAVDLGCGDGTETLALLHAGWNVLAIDGEPSGIERLLAKTPEAHRPRLQTRVEKFEELSLPPANLIYAGYSLPFCPPNHFGAMWKVITDAIKPAGLLSVHLFGIHDTWFGDPAMTFQTAEQAARLLPDSFERIMFRETDEDGPAVSGPKHWHLFEIIAQKRPRTG